MTDPRSVPTHTTPRPPAAVATDPAPIPFKIEHPAATPDQHWLNAFFYGDPGHGKTSLAATADDVPEMKDVLYFDAERGDMVLGDRPWLDVIHSKKFATLGRVQEFLSLHCRLRDAYLAGDQEARERLINLQERLTGERPDEPKLYRTFVVDTATELNQHLMYQLLSIDPDNWALDAVPAGAEWSEYKSGLDMMLITFRRLRDLPLHVIVTAHTSENEVVKPGIGKVTEKRPLLVGQKLPSRTPGFWDIFGYLQKAQNSEGKDEFRLWLNDGPGGAWKAKHRFKFVKVNYIDNPTLPKLLALAEQEWSAAEAAKRGDTTRAESNPGPTQSSPASSPARPTPVPAPTRPASSAGTGARRAPVRVAGGRPSGRR